MDRQTAPQRNYVIDLLRVLAIIGVVVIHVTSRTLENGGYDILRLNLSLILNQIFRFAVPLFFLISGFTLEYRYSKGVSAKLFYKKRIAKLLVPYIIWSGVYYLFMFNNTVSSLFSLNFVYQLLLGTAAIQMYFIPSIAVLYILFPHIHKYIHILFSKKIFVMFTIIQVLIFFADYYSTGIGIPTPLRISLLNLYIFTTGMIATHRSEQIKTFVKNNYKLLAGLIIGSFIAMYFESRFNYLNGNNINYITSQWRWSTTVYTLSIATLVFAFSNLKSEKIKKIVLELSKFSLFVFFIHLFVIASFWKVIGSYLFSKTAGHISENILFDLFATLFVLFVSFLLAYILSLIPKVGWIMGIE